MAPPRSRLGGMDWLSARFDTNPVYASVLRGKGLNVWKKPGYPPRLLAAENREHYHRRLDRALSVAVPTCVKLPATNAAPLIATQSPQLSACRSSASRMSGT